MINKALFLITIHFRRMDQPIFETRNLKKVYLSDGVENKVISNLNLKIHDGEFAVIMGSSGSGKSTLLYMLSGLDEASGGEIWLQDQPIHQLSERKLALLRRQCTGFVFQSPHLVPNLSVLENILITGYLNGGDRKEVRRRAQNLLQQTGLQELSHRLPAQLSGGQQQRVAIARALINEPRVLLADEPTGNLNSASSQAVLDLLTTFHQRGQTILMVTHDIKSASRGQRILYFRDGDVVDEWRFQNGLTDPEDREKRLTEWLLEKGW